MAVDLLVVGLGNPGAEYERSRHNCGADTVALLARRHGGSLVINPGSVGMPFEQVDGGFRNPPWAEYAIVEDGQVEFHRVPVDVGEVTSAALRSGMPNASWWVKDWAWQ